MNYGIISKISLVLEIRGKTKLYCELKKHLSPSTIGNLIRSLPLEGNAHFLGNSIVYFETPIDSGIERPTSEFKKGDIAFLPTRGCVCFFLNDIDSGKKMTPLGKITSNFDFLKQLKSGDVLSLYAETT